MLEGTCSVFVVPIHGSARTIQIWGIQMQMELLEGGIEGPCEVEHRAAVVSFPS
jgi:hypothetical protein